MKSVMASAVIISTIACAGLLSAQEFNGPRIEIREYQYDFGKVPAGTQAVHVFEVRNAGDEPLIIKGVTSS